MIDRRLFTSRVARRVFVLFLLATLLPISIFGLVAANEVSQTVVDRNRQALAANARAFGQGVYEKLTLIEDLVLRPALRDESLDATRRSTKVGDAALLDADGVREQVGDLPTGVAGSEFGTGSRSAVSAVNGQVLMAGQDGTRRIVMSIDPPFLWGTPEKLPFGSHYCVFQGDARLFCSRPMMEKASARVLAAGPSSSLRWTEQDEAWMGASWDLFIRSGFDGESWRILAMQPERVALRSLRAFQFTFAGVLVGSLIVTLLLASSQIRRTLKPLEVLVAGTRRFAQRRFDQPVDLIGDDEFTDLARAMNQMGSRLSGQFQAMEALAEVDRQILASEDIEPVLESMLRKLTDLINTELVAVLLPDPNTPDVARVYSYAAGEASVALGRMRLSDEQQRCLVEHGDGETMPVPHVSGLIARRHGRDDPGSMSCYVVRRKDVLVGALIVSDARRQYADGADVAKDFKDRLGVALTAAEREEELYRRGHFDSLTGLPNRQLLHDRLQQALALAKTVSGSGLAVVFVDLDRFKDVNDAMGHRAGDQLLCEAARRLTAMLPETATVSRLGGDEFVVVLPETKDVNLKVITREILASLAEPFEVEGVSSFISASMGIARFPEDGDTVEELLRKADTAMYEAKSAGRGTGRIFTGDMDFKVQERMTVHRDLHEALNAGQFHLLFQPKFYLANNELMGAEALVRWRHPERGEISPAEFIPVAEQTAFIAKLDQWVLQQSFACAAAWQRKGIDVPSLGINISAHSLRDEVTEEIERLIASTGVDPSKLELELTESVYARDLRKTSQLMSALRSLGLRIAIDDFGTGYSSLSYLKQLVFDTLKIDISFVRQLPHDRESVAIASAIVTMGKTLCKTVVAEGVEALEQAQCLSELGCDIGQGYFFGHPLTAKEFELRVAQQTRREAS